MPSEKWNEDQGEDVEGYGARGVEPFVARLRAFHDGLPGDQRAMLAAILNAAQTNGTEVTGQADDTEGYAAAGRYEADGEGWGQLAARLGGEHGTECRFRGLPVGPEEEDDTEGQGWVRHTGPRPEANAVEKGDSKGQGSKAI